MRWLTFISALLLTVSAAAQNNAYSIDDQCYEYFREADANVMNFDSPVFDNALQSLLSEAVKKKDAKAQTLYYVEELKRTSWQGQFKLAGEGASPTEEDFQEWNRKVEEKREILQRIALSTGYRQYFYYAYELCQTYYYNTGQTSVAIGVLTMQMDASRENGDEYGLWQSLSYLAKLYERQSDDINSKKCYLEVVRMWETTDDPTIRRQMIAQQYCRLAETFQPGSDSARLFIGKAMRVEGTRLDTMYVNLSKAQLAAWDRDFSSYEKFRDQCLGDPAFQYNVIDGKPFLNVVDKLIAKAPLADFKEDIEKIHRHARLKFVSALAAHYEQWQTAYAFSERYQERMSMDISNISRQKLDQMQAQYGNNRLSKDLDAASVKMARITTIAAVLAVVVLLVILSFVLVHLRALKKANEKIRLADAAKTRFVQNMSHEVRTPLNAIVGFSQLLSLPDGNFPEDEKEEFAGHIVNNTGMLTMLLDDILNASAMDSGGYKISYEDGELHTMCRAAITSSEHRLQPGVSMRYEPESEDTFHFRTDPRRVQQILINLLSNACKHTSAGKIVLSSSLTARPDYVTFTVTDTGTGIPDDQAEKIFERFTKLNEFVQGTGLGLSICRDIADRMGARVYLDTTYKDGGSRFVFEVPVVPVENNTNS